MIRLVNNVIDNSDVDALIAWLSTYPRLTKGEVTEEFEAKWAEYIGTKYAVFVNSGSSANLIMLLALLEAEMIKPGATVFVPAVSWATDLFPVMQLGLNPVLIDCNLETLSIDEGHLKGQIEKAPENEEKVLMLVSVLGMVPDMESIQEICRDNRVILLEDVCESLGSKYHGKRLGSFGTMSSFSTYFGHHISTIEGGMVCTDDNILAFVLKSVRSHGWGRELPEDVALRYQALYNINDFHAPFTFYFAGMNLRSTDLQAKIGLRQLEKLPYIVQKRVENFNNYQRFLENDYWKPVVKEQRVVSNFAYPIIHPEIKKVKQALDGSVETRPLICGSMEMQPAFIKKFGKETKGCYNSRKLVHEMGMYVPNNPDLTTEDIKYVCKLINEVINE